MRCCRATAAAVSLTQHGEALYSRARKMLRTNAEIMDLFSDERPGRLRSASACPTIMRCGCCR